MHRDSDAASIAELRLVLPKLLLLGGRIGAPIPNDCGTRPLAVLTDRIDEAHFQILKVCEIRRGRVGDRLKLRQRRRVIGNDRRPNGSEAQTLREVHQLSREVLYAFNMKHFKALLAEQRSWHRACLSHRKSRRRMKPKRTAHACLDDCGILPIG